MKLSQNKIFCITSHHLIYPIIRQKCLLNILLSTDYMWYLLSILNYFNCFIPPPAHNCTWFEIWRHLMSSTVNILLISLRQNVFWEKQTQTIISVCLMLCLGRRRKKTRWNKNIRKLGYGPTGFKPSVILTLSEELRYYLKYFFKVCFKYILKIKSRLTSHTL